MGLLPRQFASRSSMLAFDRGMEQKGGLAQSSRLDIEYSQFIEGHGRVPPCLVSSSMTAAAEDGRRAWFDASLDGSGRLASHASSRALIRRLGESSSHELSQTPSLIKHGKEGAVDSGWIMSEDGKSRCQLRDLPSPYEAVQNSPLVLPANQAALPAAASL